VVLTGHNQGTHSSPDPVVQDDGHIPTARDEKDVAPVIGQDDYAFAVAEILVPEEDSADLLKGVASPGV
jgi:hypothetical protein